MKGAITLATSLFMTRLSAENRLPSHIDYIGCSRQVNSTIIIISIYRR